MLFRAEAFQWVPEELPGAKEMNEAIEMLSRTHNISTCTVDGGGLGGHFKLSVELTPKASTATPLEVLPENHWHLYGKNGWSCCVVGCGRERAGFGIFAQRKSPDILLAFDLCSDHIDASDEELLDLHYDNCTFVGSALRCKLYVNGGRPLLPPGYVQGKTEIARIPLGKDGRPCGPVTLPPIPDFKDASYDARVLGKFPQEQLQVQADAHHDAVAAKECEDCYGTGFYRGFGAPCKKGCKS